MILLASGIGSFVGTVTAQQDLAVTAVNVTPSDPAPGDRVQFSTTISNLQSSSETVQVTDVYVRRQSGGELARVEDLGSIAVGSSMTVPMSFSFARGGEKDLRVHVVARDSNGYQRIQYPVHVTVDGSRAVNLAITADDVEAGEESRVNVTVANGGSSSITNAELVLGGDGQVNNPRRVSGSIPAETDREYSYVVTFADAGTRTVEATLRYTVDGDFSRTTTESMDVSVEPASAGTEGRIQLTGIETTSVGTRITIDGDAANVGTTDAQSVLLSIQATDGVTPVQPSGEYFIGTVEGSEFGTFELTANVEESVSAVPVLVEWTVDDERRSEVVQLNIGTGTQRSGGNTPSSGRGSGGGSSGILGNTGVGTLVLVLVVIGIPLIAYFAWKRR